MSTAPPAPPAGPATVPVTSAPPAAPGAPTLQLPAVAARRRGWSQRSTPTLLRAVQVLLAVVAILFGVVIAVDAGGRIARIDDARRAADVVEASQQLRAALGRADAASAGAFLNGGVDQPEQRQRYRAAIDEAAAALQTAGGAAEDPGAVEAITQLNRLLPRYSGLIETARAANRQQLPLGAAYLRSASELVRTDIDAQLDVLDERGDTDFRDQVGTITGGLGLPTVAMAVVALAVFALAGRWLARRTRRLLNPGVVLAVAILVVGLGWVGSATGSSAQASVAAVRGGYDELSALSAIGADAYDHQVSSTFALIDRGARDGFYARAATAAQNVDARLVAADDRSGLQNAWGAYLAASQAAVELDSAGQFVQARALLTAGSDEPDSIAARFGAFDETLAARVTSAGSGLSSDLLDARQPIARLRIVGLVIGVVAAAVAAWGVQRRINDYR